MTRTDLDAHGCRLADLWHEAGSRDREVRVPYESNRVKRLRSDCIGMAASIAGGDAAVACYLGARVFDRLRYMGAPMDAQLWLDDLERWAVVSTGG